jgi:hypothetical protein
LNAPWGAGKSFLYKLIKAELERNNTARIHENREKNSKNVATDEKKRNWWMLRTIFKIFKIWYFFDGLMRSILSNYCSLVRDSIWTEPLQHHILMNLFSMFVVFTPLTLLVFTVVFALGALVILSIALFLCWVALMQMIDLLKKPAFDAFTKIIHIANAFAKIICNENMNDTEENKSIDKNIKIAAILITTPFIWFLPWVLFFLLLIALLKSLVSYCLVFSSRNLFDNI